MCIWKRKYLGEKAKMAGLLRPAIYLRMRNLIFHLHYQDTSGPSGAAVQGRCKPYSEAYITGEISIRTIFHLSYILMSSSLLTGHSAGRKVRICIWDTWYHWGEWCENYVMLPFYWMYVPGSAWQSEEVFRIVWQSNPACQQRTWNGQDSILVLIILSILNIRGRAHIT